MPINEVHKSRFVEKSFYHVYNRCVKSQSLFYTDENYKYFLKLFDRHLSGVLKVYSWCLIPNHFHFLVSNKLHTECSFLERELQLLQNKPNSYPSIVSSRWKNFFISYSLALRRQENIRTNIFAQKFKHIEVTTDAQFKNTIQYIHHNPAHHHIMKDFQNYRWSSYSRILNDHQSKLEKNYVLDLFGGKEQYIQSHLDYDTNFKCGFEDL